MSDDLIPPVPPAERVFKVPPPQREIYGQESKKLSGDVIKNKISPEGKAAKGSLLENFRQLFKKGSIYMADRLPSGGKARAPPAAGGTPIVVRFTDTFAGDGFRQTAFDDRYRPGFGQQGVDRGLGPFDGVCCNRRGQQRIQYRQVDAEHFSHQIWKIDFGGCRSVSAGGSLSPGRCAAGTYSTPWVKSKPRSCLNRWLRRNRPSRN